METNDEFLYHSSQGIWTLISKYVNRDCSGCNSHSADHTHLCQILWSDYHLIYSGWARWFFEKYYDTAFTELSWENVLLKCNTLKSHKFYATSYKRTIMRELLFSRLQTDLHETTVNNCYYYTPKK